MKKNKTRYAVLGLLSMESMSGYDIKKRFESLASNFWNESYGQIYPILKRLVNEEMATRSIQKQEGKPDRHIYTLTQKGHKELEFWLKEKVEPYVGRHEILLKLFFGDKIPVKDNLRQLAHFKTMHEKELSDLKSLKKNLTAENQGKSYFPYWMMTVRFGELVNEAYVKWADEILGQMEQMK
jgi:PadR family transcriptional regulator, regulatory protein AphA